MIQGQDHTVGQGHRSFQALQVNSSVTNHHIKKNNNSTPGFFWYGECVCAISFVIECKTHTLDQDHRSFKTL